MRVNKAMTNVTSSVRTIFDVFGMRSTYICMTSVAMLAGSAVGAPRLERCITTVGTNGPQTELALDGPVSVERRDVSTYGVTMRFEFDEAILGFRRVEASGAEVVSVAHKSGQSAIEVVLDGIDDASHVRVRIIDAVSASGIMDADGRFRAFGADFTGDGFRNVLDVQRFLNFYRVQDAQADMNDDGLANVLDVFKFLEFYNSPINAMPNAAPTIEIVGETDEERMMARYADPGAFSLPFTVRIRDDATPTESLTINAMSTNQSVVTDTDIELLGSDSLRTVRFRGATGADGTSQVFLTVSDGELTSEVCFVAGVEENTAPIAIALCDTFLGPAPLIVSFDASQSTDDQNNITDVAWDFGAFGTESGEKQRLVFTAPGTYEVSCTVTDAGGLSDTTTRAITVAPSAYVPGGPVSEEEARRFLWQAAWGPGKDDVAYVMANGFEAWIDDQLAKAPNYITRELNEAGEQYNRPRNAENLWDDIRVEGEDQLRQRIAWALSQIFAIRETNDEYEVYSLFIKHALPDAGTGSNGNFRDLLSDITYNRIMGEWLTFINNKKANPSTGSEPDQNYAREVQQLFSIGLYELFDDGTRLKNLYGEDIPTYNQYRIEQFSRVFTGLRGDYPNEIMVMRTRDHEFGESFLHNYAGAVPENGYLAPSEESEQEAFADIEGGLDNLFYHPTHAPFIAHLLILRTTTSNPSPAYVQRVAQAYAGNGPYGSGVRGDLTATFKAILLDDEARNPAYRSNPFSGKVLEPEVIRAGSHRAIMRLDDRSVPFPYRLSFGYQGNAFDDFGQGFMFTPTVFNFYQPEFAPLNTAISKAGLVAPEIQIIDDNTAIRAPSKYDDISRLDQIDPEMLAELVALADDPAALVDWSIRVFHYNATDPAIRQILIDAVASVTNNNAERQANDRIEMALALVVMNPGFHHLR